LRDAACGGWYTANEALHAVETALLGDRFHDRRLEKNGSVAAAVEV
jgi:hypothetical protein